MNKKPPDLTQAFLAAHDRGEHGQSDVDGRVRQHADESCDAAARLAQIGRIGRKRGYTLLDLRDYVEG